MSGHPDVRGMVVGMEGQIEAGRALALEAGLLLDLAKTGDHEAAAQVNLLTPVVKAWCTDMANEVAGLGVQVHGGMGFIEETGAAQYVRDARILSIYEGTNGVQAQDLYIQKLSRDRGAAMQDWLLAAENIVKTTYDDPALAEAAKRLTTALSTLREANAVMLDYDVLHGAAVSVPYLRLFGHIAGAMMLFRSAVAAKEQRDNSGDTTFYQEKITAMAFYLTHILPETTAFLETIRTGSDTVTSTETGIFGKEI